MFTLALNKAYRHCFIKSQAEAPEVDSITTPTGRGYLSFNILNTFTMNNLVFQWQGVFNG